MHFFKKDNFGKKIYHNVLGASLMIYKLKAKIHKLYLYKNDHGMGSQNSYRSTRRADGPI